MTVPAGVRRDDLWTPGARMVGQQWAASMTALLLALFIAFIGTPAWWTSTEIYRARLPFDRIRSLGLQTTALPVDVYILDAQPETAAAVSEHLRQRLQPTTVIHDGTCGVNVHYTVHNNATAEQAAAIRGVDGEGQGNRRDYGFVLNEGDTTEGVPIIHMGDSRVFKVVQPAGTSAAVTAMAIASFVETVVVDHDGIAIEAQKASVGKRGARTPSGTEAVQRELAVPINANYDIELALLVANPDTTPVTWDVGDAVARYLAPMLARLKFLGELTTSSQVLYYLQPGVSPVESPTGKGRSVTYSQLTEFVDNDWPLASVTGSSLTTPLNFLIYVPAREDGPWQVIDRDGSAVASNGFTIPQWGGLHLANPPPATGDTDTATTAAVDMRRSMSIVVTQLRTLLGLRSTKDEIHKPSDHRVVVEPDSYRNGISLVETDRIMRRRLVELVAKSTSTLADLSNLLEEVEKMAIRDEIAVQVGDCLDSLDRARQELSSAATNGYDRAYAAARDAMISSETAFFDPTVVKLLYFPDDNKYAIYVPLFVPLFFTLGAQLKAERSHIAALIFGRK